MKKNIGYVISFILGAIIFGGIGVYASTALNSKDATYSNTSSGLSATNVQSALDELASRTKVGNATAAQILSGKIALVGGSKITGTMTNNGAKNATINPGGSYTIPAGYHNGSGKVTANANQNSGTYTPTSRSSSLDMGVNNTIRYVNTNSVPNTNSGTYTYASGSTGGKVDLGATNTYRYVDASNVYTKGYNTGKSDAISSLNNAVHYVFSSYNTSDWKSVANSDNDTSTVLATASVDLTNVKYIFMAAYVDGKTYYGDYAGAYMYVDSTKVFEITSATSKYVFADVKSLTGSHTIKLTGSSKHGNGKDSVLYITGARLIY